MSDSIILFEDEVFLIELEKYQSREDFEWNDKERIAIRDKYKRGCTRVSVEAFTKAFEQLDERRQQFEKRVLINRVPELKEQ
jgi:hypothetical protein